MVVSHKLFSPTRDSHPPGGDYKCKASDHLCFYSHKYCGITTSNYSQCLHDIDHLDINLYCFVKTNLHTNHIQVEHKLYNITKYHFPYFYSIWLTSDTYSMTDFKPGRTSLLATKILVSRIKHQWQNRLGRYCYLQLQDWGNQEVLIIVIYQRCSRPTNSTENSSLTQQWILLSHMDSPNSNPRVNFLSRPLHTNPGLPIPEPSLYSYYYGWLEWDLSRLLNLSQTLQNLWTCWCLEIQASQYQILELSTQKQPHSFCYHYTAASTTCYNDLWTIFLPA